jgi:hypothetical protein
MPLFGRSIVHAASAAAEEGELVTRWSYDEPTGQSVITRVQDVEPILEANKQLYTADDGYSPSREWRRVARIPAIVIEQWAKEGVRYWDKNCRAEIRRRLNDPTNLFLRTAPGRL